MSFTDWPSARRQQFFKNLLDGSITQKLQEETTRTTAGEKNVATPAYAGIVIEALRELNVPFPEWSADLKLSVTDWFEDKGLTITILEPLSPGTKFVLETFVRDTTKLVVEAAKNLEGFTPYHQELDELVAIPLTNIKEPRPDEKADSDVEIEILSPEEVARFEIEKKNRAGDDFFRERGRRALLPDGVDPLEEKDDEITVPIPKEGRTPPSFPLKRK